jgi:hypothetical protein
MEVKNQKEIKYKIQMIISSNNPNNKMILFYIDKYPNIKIYSIDKELIT